MQKRWIFIGLKILIACIVMLMLLKSIQFDRIKEAFQDPRQPVFILIAAGLLLPNLYLQWYRWHFLLTRMDSSRSWKDSAVSLFGGMVMGFITPGRIGEAGRSLFIQGGDRLMMVGLVLLDKIYAFLCILCGGIWGMILMLTYHFQYAPFLTIPLYLVTLIFTVGILLILLNPKWIRTALYHLSLILPYRDRLKTIIQCMDRFGRPQARIFLFYSLLHYGLYIIQFCLLAFAFQSISWTTALTATSASMLTKTLIPISFADLGIREAASIYFFLKFNVTKVTAFNSAILLFTINIFIPTLIGLFFLPRLGGSSKDHQRSPS